MPKDFKKAFSTLEDIQVSEFVVKVIRETLEKVWKEEDSPDELTSYKDTITENGFSLQEVLYFLYGHFNVEIPREDSKELIASRFKTLPHGRRQSGYQGKRLR